MKITWYGLSSLRLRHKNKIVYIDPLGEKYGLKSRRLKADLVLTSAPEKLDYNLSSYKDDTFLVDGPGEYESSEVYVIGSKAEGDRKNTIYYLSMGTFGILNLGVLADSEGLMQAIEDTTNVNILFLPIGGNDALSYEKANKVINQIEAGLIIPTFYKTEGVKGVDDLQDEEKFLEEAGVEDPRREDELKVKKSKLDPEDPEFVLLNPQ